VKGSLTAAALLLTAGAAAGVDRALSEVADYFDRLTRAKAVSFR
jgi:hypothetical protein